jgi:hypothetical protein
LAKLERLELLWSSSALFSSSRRDSLLMLLLLAPDDIDLFTSATTALAPDLQDMFPLSFVRANFGPITPL